MAVGEGSGKLILVGEHAVVYGHEAIAFAVGLRTRVALEPRPGPTQIVGPDVDDRVLTALCTVLPREGFAVRVASDVPVGRGMGSSAALAVALVRALHPDLGPDAVIDAAMPIERAFHGNPSGLDVAVSAHGGCVRFRRGPPMVFAPVTTGEWQVVVADSGAPGNTAELVARVAAQRPAVDPTLARIGALVAEASRALHDPRALGPLLTENHRLLAALGVSTPRLDDLVARALRAGAYGAKLAGAGGGGVVLALVDDPAPVIAAMRDAGVVAWSTRPAQGSR